MSNVREINSATLAQLVRKSKELDRINSAGVYSAVSHQKVTIDRSTLNTLVSNTRDLQALYAAGVQDWEGYDSVDWDNE